MAYGNKSAAYDLSLFDESAYSSSAAPKSRPQRVHKQHNEKTKNTSKVVSLPESEIQKIRRRKHNPLKLVLGSIGSLAVTAVIGFIIVGQVQLTELNQQIITAKTDLTNSQSIYTQNQMKVESKLSNAEIEEYATGVLGMTKATNAQKEYVALAGGDKAEVSAPKGENLFTQFIDSVKNLWS